MEMRTELNITFNLSIRDSKQLRSELAEVMSDDTPALQELHRRLDNSLDERNLY